VQVDLDAWPFRNGAFDVIVQTDFLDRQLLPVLADALRCGGMLLIDTFLAAAHPNAEGPSNPDYILRRNELPAIYSHLDLLHYCEVDGATARARLLARRTR